MDGDVNSQVCTGGMPLFESQVEPAELTMCCGQSCKGGAGPHLRLEGSGINALVWSSRWDPGPYGGG